MINIGNKDLTYPGWVTSGGLYVCLERWIMVSGGWRCVCGVSYTSVVNDKEDSIFFKNLAWCQWRWQNPAGCSVGWSDTVGVLYCPMENTRRVHSLWALTLPLVWCLEENSLAVKVQMCLTQKCKDWLLRQNPPFSILQSVPWVRSRKSALIASLWRLGGPGFALCRWQNWLFSGTLVEWGVGFFSLGHEAVLSSHIILSCCHLLLLGWSGTWSEWMGSSLGDYSHSKYGSSCSL